MLASLDSVKTILGISLTDSSEDTYLLALIGQFTGMVRHIRKSWQGAVILSIATDGVVTSANHMLDDGDTVRLRGTGDATIESPVEHAITYLTPDTFQITASPAVAIEGRGFIQRKMTGTLSGHGHPTLFLNQKPIAELVEVKYDGEVLTEGTDYWFQAGEFGQYCGIQKIQGVWASTYNRIPGTLKLTYQTTNRDVEYTAWVGGPADPIVVGAMAALIDEERTTVGVSSRTSSRSWEGASESYFSPQQLETSGGGDNGGGPYAALVEALGGKRLGY